MELITPDSLHKCNISEYKNSMQHLPRGSRVLILRSEASGLAEALIGNWELGLVSIPVNTRVVSPQIKNFITQNCEPHAIVNCTNKETIYEFRDGGELSPITDYGIFYTSGSTDKPKGVVQTRTGLEHNSKSTAQLHNFRNTSSHLSALPLHHCNAVAMSLFGCYFSDSRCILMNKFVPDNIFKVVEQYQVEVMNVVPSMIESLISSDLKFPDCLKYLLTAAAPLSKDLAEKFYTKYGNRLCQGYGLSEAINFSFTMPFLNNKDFKKEYVDNYPPVGLILKEQYFRIVEKEIQIKGINIMRCYWNLPGETIKAMTKDGWLKTGDTGFIRGNYLILDGRKKEMIIKNGESISPLTIEFEIKQSNVDGKVLAVTCKNGNIGDEIGLICEKYQPIHMNFKRFLPATVRYRKIEYTSTMKPKRRLMSKGMVSKVRNADRYESIRKQAKKLSMLILKYKPYNLHQQKIIDIANFLSEQEISEHSTKLYPETNEFFKRLEESLHKWWSNDFNYDIFKGLSWDLLFSEYPLRGYKELINEYCVENSVSQLNAINISSRYYSASKPKNNKGILLSKCQVIKKYTDQDGYTRLFSWKEFNNIIHGTCNTIILENATQCIKDKKSIVVQSYKILKKGGYLIIGGVDMSKDLNGIDLLFEFSDSPTSIRLSRHYWLGLFQQFIHEEIGYSTYREGRYDLGGIVWMKK